MLRAALVGNAVSLHDHNEYFAKIAIMQRDEIVSLNVERQRNVKFIMSSTVSPLESVLPSQKA